MNCFRKILPFALLFSACLPGEDAVTPYPRGDRKEVFLNNGEQKNLVHFLDLKAGAVIASAHPMDWDIRVGDGMEINFHRFIRVAQSADDIADVADTAGLTFSPLQQDSAPWSLVPETNYVLDMGLDDARKSLGFFVLRFAQEGDSLRCRYGRLGSTVSERRVAKGSYWNMRTDALVDLPFNHDLSFGKYVHYFVDEEVEYEVYGAISRELEVAVTTLDFEQIEASTADTLIWSPKRDAIGYDWKYYNLQKGAYEIDADRNYVLRTADGFLFKFRFTGFYDPDGKSGHPTIEFQLI